MAGLSGPTDPAWSALTATKARYDRPTIFARVCAREIASLRRDARHALKRRNWTIATQRYREILGHIPRDITARLQLVRIFMLTDKLDQAYQLAHDVATDQKVGAVARGHADEAIGDIRALRGDLKGALHQYNLVQPKVFNRHRLRILAIKIESLQHPHARVEALEYLLGHWSPKDRMKKTKTS